MGSSSSSPAQVPVQPTRIPTSYAPSFDTYEEQPSSWSFSDPEIVRLYPSDFVSYPDDEPDNNPSPIAEGRRRPRPPPPPSSPSTVPPTTTALPRPTSSNHSVTRITEINPRLTRPQPSPPPSTLSTVPPTTTTLHRPTSSNHSVTRITEVTPVRTRPQPPPVTTTRSQPSSSTHLITTSSQPVKTLQQPKSHRQSTSSSFTPAKGIPGCPFKKGDKVKLIAISEDQLKSLANGDRKWDPNTIKYINQSGMVNGIGDNRVVTFDFNDSQIRWTFNGPTNPVLLGDEVKLIDCEAKLKVLQRGHGEYVPEMSEFLGRNGIVFKVFTDGDLKVSFDGGSWILNPQSVINLSGNRKKTQKWPNSSRVRRKEKRLKDRLKPPNVESKQQPTSSGPSSGKCPFTIGDQVKVIAIKFNEFKELQKGHGGWNPRMAQSINKTGILIEITDNQDATVLFNHSRLSWTLNPEVLRKHFAGDIVKVIKDIKMKKFMHKNNKYAPELVNIRGETGVVVDTDNDGAFIVKSGDNTWNLNPSNVMNLSELERINNQKKLEKDKDKKQEEESISWKDWLKDLINENAELDPLLTSLNNRSYKTDEDSNIHSLISKNRQLQEQLNKLEEANCCGICLENPKKLLFICGHGACSVCATSLMSCHLCRRPIMYKIPIY